MPRNPRRAISMLALAASMLLAGCQSTMQRIADCKAGDWNVIGHKDGLTGEPQNFDTRKDFCDKQDGSKPAPDAAANYLAGWAQGNWDLWAELGRADARKALPAAQFEQHAASAGVKKDGTPLNRPAYEAGWLVGNGEYWSDIGKRDGTEGKPLSQRDAARGDAAARALRFDEAAYQAGWQTGNRTFWQDAGFTDARNGLPDSEFKGRAAKARAAGVQVAEDAYRAAWNAEIVNYWKNLGAQDAMSGKDISMRRAEAKQKGLKIFEAEYRQAWEERLAAYWSKAGHDDGYGKPFQLDERMAQAKRDGIFTIARTRELYTAAWDAENAKYCVPENAFELGRRSEVMAIEVCQIPQRDQLKRVYLGGQEFESLTIRHARAVADINELSDRLRDAYNRLGRLDREPRSSQDSKDKAANEEAAKQERRRGQERRELIDYIRRLERQLDDARRWADRYEQQMQRLRRDLFLN